MMMLIRFARPTLGHGHGLRRMAVTHGATV